MQHLHHVSTRSCASQAIVANDFPSHRLHPPPSPPLSHPYFEICILESRIEVSDGVYQCLLGEWVDPLHSTLMPINGRWSHRKPLRQVAGFRFQALRAPCSRTSRSLIAWTAWVTFIWRLNRLRKGTPSSPSSLFQHKSLLDRMVCLGTIHLETEQVEEGYNFNDAAIFHRGQRGADSEVPTSGNGDGYSGGSGGSGDKECLLSMNGIAVHGSIQR